MHRFAFVFIASVFFLILVFYAIPILQMKAISCGDHINKFMEDDAFEVPSRLQPKWSVEEHYRRRRRVFASKRWGDVHHDGPDRAMPDDCYWFRGMLHCRS